MNIQVSLRRGDEGSELALILAADVLEGKHSSGLLVDHRAKASLALNDHIWNTHLAAQGGEEDNELNGVDIVSNDDEVGLLGFNEGNTVVEAVLDEERLLGFLGLSLLLLGSSLSGSLETSLLLLLSLRAVPAVMFSICHPIE